MWVDPHLVPAGVRVAAPHPDLVTPEVAGDEGDDLLHVDAFACTAQMQRAACGTVHMHIEPRDYQNCEGLGQDQPLF